MTRDSFKWVSIHAQRGCDASHQTLTPTRGTIKQWHSGGRRREGINKSEQTSSHNIGFTLHEIWSNRKTHRRNKAEEPRPSTQEQSKKHLRQGTNLHRRVRLVWFTLRSSRLHLIVNSPVQHLQDRKSGFLLLFHLFIHLFMQQKSHFNKSRSLHRLLHFILVTLEDIRRMTSSTEIRKFHSKIKKSNDRAKRDLNESELHHWACSHDHNNQIFGLIW